MSRVADQWSSLWPALAFLLAGVPLAALLDRLGFFEAAASVMLGDRGRDQPVLALWVLAAVTTAVLNLDTTAVLLTPVVFATASRMGVRPKPHAYACTHLANAIGSPDRRALAIGGAVVAGLLVGFVLGPTIGVDAWIVALAADVALMLVVRTLPWREVPVTTAVLVAAIAAAVALVVPDDALRTPLHHSSPVAVGVLAVAAGALANAVNNLPALLVGADALHHMTWGMWAWLLGLNVAAVLLPIGALANLLWLRIMRAEGVPVRLRRYVGVTVPVALPAGAAAIAVLALERIVAA